MTPTTALAIRHSVETSDTSRVVLGLTDRATGGDFVLKLEVEDNRVDAADVVCGFRHSGIEKTAEELTYVQLGANIARMDGRAPCFAETAVAQAIENLMGVVVPRRAEFLRILVMELQRIASHIAALSGACQPMGFVAAASQGRMLNRQIVDFFEGLTGTRRSYNYVRPGGVVVDLHYGWQDQLDELCKRASRWASQFERKVVSSSLFRSATVGLGVLALDDAAALAVTGPILRASGSTKDLRRDDSYGAYEMFHFDVISADTGDAMARHLVRLMEIGESVRMLGQIEVLLDYGNVRTLDVEVTPVARKWTPTDPMVMAEFIEHFAAGYEVPPGSAYAAVESPRGELGCFLVADGTNRPRRVHMRTGSFANIAALPLALSGVAMDDVSTVVRSFDISIDEVDR